MHAMCLTLTWLARGMRNGNTDVVMIFQQARHQGRFTCAGSGRNDVNIAFFYDFAWWFSRWYVFVNYNTTQCFSEFQTACCKIWLLYRLIWQVRI